MSTITWHIKFAAPLTFSEFEGDDLHQLAMHPDILGTEIIGMRNCFVHAGFAIQHDVLWQTVGNDLPPLIAQLEALVPPEPE